MDWLDLIEYVAPKLAPLIQLYKILDFTFGISRVDSERAHFQLRLKDYEKEYDFRSSILIQQLTEIKATREFYTSQLDELRAERFAIDRNILLLGELARNDYFPENIRHQAAIGIIDLSKAKFDNYGASIITLDKLPEISMNFGNIQFPTLNM